MTTKPSVGAVINLTTRHKTNVQFLGPTVDYRYENATVVENAKWVSPLEFTIMDGKVRRIIHTSVVVDLDVVSGTSSDVQTETKTIKVSGSKGEVYEVTLEDGRATCTCPAFTFRKTCKHLKALDE